jgi:uncharacterized protein YjeT (DUF2065 family)
VDWQTVGLAIALMLVFEGLMPFAFPSDGQIRFIGLASVGAGLLLFALVS